MIRRLFIVLLFVTLGEARKPFLSFLSTARTEILFFTKTEETVLVRSTYRDKRPNASFLSVRLQDPEMLQVVNVTRASSGATTFIIKLVAEEEGETNLTIQLWDSEVPALGLLFGYCSAKSCRLPPAVCKTVAIESGALNSFLALAIIQLALPQSQADAASVAPFTVALCSGCEMLLILLLYKAKKRCILITREERKHPPRSSNQSTAACPL
ncbi:Sodium/bile acid cotransporter 5 [Myotis brandtii]|uniref:Sodium/bile acid cotransporter 5 n=1 Tax=Myotis brandtii TaxID=109478 RepID=S7ND89_MYOBR|nr:Sodium/bile acid cotransporter 5 [Myotis brandtii]